jgi:hypothetical protein
MLFYVEEEGVSSGTEILGCEGYATKRTSVSALRHHYCRAGVATGEYNRDNARGVSYLEKLCGGCSSAGAISL